MKTRAEIEAEIDRLDDKLRNELLGLSGSVAIVARREALLWALNREDEIL